MNGASCFSNNAEFLTPASVPSMVGSVRVDAVSTDSLVISWKQPNSNGSPIHFYNVDFSELNAPTNANSSYIVVNQPQTSNDHVEYKIDMLMPDTNYKVRVQAANSVGVGPFSNVTKLRTKALAPLPPHMECVSTSYNSIKLKWFTGALSMSSSGSFNDGNLTAAGFANSLAVSSTAVSSSLSSSKSNALSNDYQIVYNLEMMLEHLPSSASNKLNRKKKINQVDSTTTTVNTAADRCETNEQTQNGQTAADEKQASDDDERADANEQLERDHQHEHENEDEYEDENEFRSFTLVYKGPLNAFKVTKLRESSVYLFRISATNEAGQGKWSDVYKFSTTKSPPIVNKGNLKLLSIFLHHSISQELNSNTKKYKAKILYFPSKLCIIHQSTSRFRKYLVILVYFNNWLKYFI